MEKGRRILPRNPGNMFCGTHDIQPNLESRIQRTFNFTGGPQNEQNLMNFRNADMHSPIRGIHGGEKAFLKKLKGLKARYLYRGYDFMYVSNNLRGCRIERLIRSQMPDVIQTPIYK